MPTDEQSTQVSDATAHQNQQDAQNATAHSESEKQFDARRAFDATNEKVNKLAKTLEKFDPAILDQIAEKVGIGKVVEEAKKVDTPDVQSLVQLEVWQAQNADRIAKANEDGKYDLYRQEGIKPAHALRLAEQDLGIQVDTSKQDKQKKISTASASVDRSAAAPLPEALKGYMTEEEYKKYAPQAAQVRITR